MLTNPVYIGKLRRRSGDVPGAHKAILPPALFARVQRRLAKQREVHPKSRSRSLAGILRCGHCGARLMVHNSHGGGSYVCQGLQWLPPGQQDHQRYHRRPRLDIAVWKVCKQVVNGVGGIPGTELDTGPLRALRDEEARLEGELSRVLMIPRALFIARTALHT